MALIRTTRSAQYPLHSIFNWAVTDTMANTSGVVQSLKATGAGPFEVIKLPVGAVVVGGELVVNTVDNDSGVCTVAVGDSASSTRYLAATTLKTAGRTALVPTGYKGLGEDLRITLVNTNGDATAGNFTLRLQYVIEGRANEAVTN